MNIKTGKMIYTSCIFSSILGVLLCGAVITAEKLSSDLSANLVANQLTQSNQDDHDQLATLHSDKVHKV